MGVSVGRRMVGLYMPSNVSNAWLFVDVSVCCCSVQVCLPCRRDWGCVWTSQVPWLCAVWIRPRLTNKVVRSQSHGSYNDMVWCPVEVARRLIHTKTSTSFHRISLSSISSQLSTLPVRRPHRPITTDPPADYHAISRYSGLASSFNGISTTSTATTKRTPNTYGQRSHSEIMQSIV